MGRLLLGNLLRNRLFDQILQTIHTQVKLLQLANDSVRVLQIVEALDRVEKRLLLSFERNATLTGKNTRNFK